MSGQLGLLDREEPQIANHRNWRKSQIAERGMVKISLTLKLCLPRRKERADLCLKYNSLNYSDVLISLVAIWIWYLNHVVCSDKGNCRDSMGFQHFHGHIRQEQSLLSKHRNGIRKHFCCLGPTPLVDYVQGGTSLMSWAWETMSVNQF